jgi:type IV pilus assembly protein PilB
MADDTQERNQGEQLIKQDLITREDLDSARASEARSGVPWYKQLIAQRKITFEALDNVLRYEFHSKAARTAHESLGEALVRRGRLTRDQLDAVLAEQRHSGRLLGSILSESGFVSRSDIAAVMSEQHGLDYADIDATPSDAEALEAMPEHIALKNGMLPVHAEGDRITVLATRPQARERAKNVAIMLGRRIDVVLTACADMEDEIRARYRELADDDYAAGNSVMEEKPVETPKDNGTVSEDAQAAESERFTDVARQAAGASVIRMVNAILEGAINAEATDVHLDPQDPETRVRYRIDGILHDVTSIPRHLHGAAVSRVKILADMDITETRHPQDGHFGTTINGRDLDVRVATLPTFLGERVVLRLLDQASVLSGVRDLGLEKEDEAKMLRLIEQPYGMILVTGPTGSGKTTTLYAALNQKNVMTESIVTLEDPVEYQLSGINQVQVDTDIGLTFASMLRASLRQDIDVLLVGEIRDQETAQIAVRASMTGHLVFSTLHTNDALEAIGTLRNMGVPSFLISSALTGVIGQRLVRKICLECKAAFKPTAALLASVGMPPAVKRLYRGAGCQKCHFTGSAGRTGVFEVLEVTPELRALILKDAAPAQIVKAADFKSMADRCREKVRAGITTPEEYLRVIRL